MRPIEKGDEVITAAAGFPTTVNPIIQNGWKPDLRRLEQIEDVSLMQRADYQEAWAWIHYLLQGNPDGPRMLTAYLQSLKSVSHAPSFAGQLAKELPALSDRMTVHVASLSLPVMTSGHSIQEVGDDAVTR